MAGSIRIEREGAVGTIYFDHPERRNAITRDMWRAIPDAAAGLDADDAIRVVVLRGAGDVAFVSGADISEFGEERSGVGAEAYDQENARAFTAIASIRKPVVAAIHGFCVGGGCALALTADLRYCADDAVFAIPAGRLGLGYSAGGIAALVRVVGEPAAKEIFFTARRFDAEEARERGLVNDVRPKPELDDFVARTCEAIASNAPLTLRSAKQVLTELPKAHDQRDHAGIAASIRACYESRDYGEGVKAFLEKRKPRFEGR